VELWISFEESCSGLISTAHSMVEGSVSIDLLVLNLKAKIYVRYHHTT
jgi:hypothetical protein